jgi:hypothetical protein
MEGKMWDEIKIETVDKEYNRVFSNDESAFLWFKNFCHKYGLRVIECHNYNRWIVEGWNDWTNFMLWNSYSGPRHDPDFYPEDYVREPRDRPHIETNINHPFEIAYKKIPNKLDNSLSTAFDELGIGISRAEFAIDINEEHLDTYTFGWKSKDTLSILEEKMKEIIEMKKETI